MRPCGIGCRLPVAGTTKFKLSNYNANYPDPEHTVNMSEINNCHNVTVKSWYLLYTNEKSAGLGPVLGLLVTS